MRKKFITSLSKVLLIITLSGVFLQNANAADADGLNMLPNTGFTKIQCGGVTCTDGATASVKTGAKSGFGGVAYSNTTSKIYTLTDAALTKVRIYSADGTFTDKNLLDPVTTGTQMRSVSLRFNEATNRLYIFGISGVGDYSFSSPTGTKTLTAMNNDLFILILDNQGNLLNVASMLGSNGTDSEVGGASPQEDAAGSFYIFGKNAGKGVVIKMSGTAAVDGSDIEHIATFTGVTNFGGVAPIDNSNFFALGKDSATSKTFVAKISNVTYASTGTILNFDTATVPRALDYTNGSIYAIMDFTGATTAIPSTPATTANNPNAGGLNSILIASIANYDTTATLATKVIGNTGGATSFNAYFKEKNRDVMVIGGTYTGNGDLGVGSPVTNNGSTDAFMAKIGFNLAAIGQTVISSAGAESIAGGSNGLTNYYYFLDNAGNISQYVSNGMLSAGVCGVGFTASMKTMLVGSGASTSYVNGTFNTTAAQTMPAATVSELGGGGLNYTTIGGTQYGVNSFPYNILNYPWVNSNDNGLIMYNGFRNYGPTDLGVHTALNQALVNTKIPDFKKQSSLNFLQGSILGNNGLSFNQWYTLKGITNDMFFNLERTTNMYVDWTDFRSYTKTDVETNVAVVGAGGLTIGDFYIYARGLQNVGWTIDYMDTSTDPANKVTYRKIGNKWPMTDPLERIAVFPVKDKSQGNKVVAFYEYDCGNLVCSTPNCLEFKNTVNVATKYVCGNSIIDPGEQCDTGGGGIFTNADQLQYGTSMQNAAGQSPYVLSCNADCTRSVTRSTSVASIPGGAYEQRVLTCTPDVIPATYCGDGTIQTPNAQGINEQCELNDPTCGRVGADACKFVISNYCGDGVVQTPDSQGIVEECDDGLNGSATCTKTCVKTPLAIQYSCGNGIIDAGNGEVCDGTVGTTPGTNHCAIDCKSLMTDAPVITPTSPASTPYCGNNTIDGNEQCDGNDMPVGKNRTNGYSCDPNCQLTIIPSNIPTGTGSCGDGNINNSLHGGVLTAEDCDFGTNPITTWTNGTLGRSCGFPTIPDPASFTGGTLENPKACKFEGCGDGVVDAGESCDFGSAGNNGTTASGGVACSPQCKVVNLQCGNGRIDAGESCDFGSKNNTSYAENGFSCDNSCQYVATANTCSAPSTNLEGPKSAFLYFRSDHLDLGYKIYSVDSSNNWSINDVKLPTAPNELLSYGLDTAGVGKHSEKSSSELQVGKTAIDNFTMSAKTTKAFSRKQSLFDFIIGGRVQRLVDKTNRVDSLSFNLGDVLMGGYGVRNTGFYHIVSLLRGTPMDVVMKDCNGAYTGQGKVNVIGIIDGDNNSINLIKSYGSLLPTNPYIIGGFIN